jgi:hypothetical protein
LQTQERRFTVREIDNIAQYEAWVDELEARCAGYQRQAEQLRRRIASAAEAIKDRKTVMEEAQTAKFCNGIRKLIRANMRETITSFELPEPDKKVWRSYLRL